MTKQKKTCPAHAWIQNSVQVMSVTAILLLLPSAIMFQTAKTMENLGHNSGALESVADAMFYTGLAFTPVVVALWIAYRLTNRRPAGFAS